jgi:hypothetical protein
MLPYHRTNHRSLTVAAPCQAVHPGPGRDRKRALSGGAR